MKNVPITLSLPENVVKDLHLYVSRRQISKFVAQTVEKGLELKKEQLAKEFREANKDPDRNADIKLWDIPNETHKLVLERAKIPGINDHKWACIDLILAHL